MNRLLLISLAMLISCSNLTKEAPSSNVVADTLDKTFSIEEIIVDIRSDTMSNLIRIDTVSFPSLNEAEILILEVEGMGGKYGHYIVGTTSRGQNLTSEPIYIDGRWGRERENGFEEKYRLLDYPLYGFEDINGDEKLEFYFKRRAHNGTAYNASTTHYFSFNQGDELSRVAIYEDKTLHPFEDCIINRLREGNRFNVSANCSGEIRNIGYYLVEWAGGIPMIDKVVVEESRYEDLLVSGIGRDKNAFIRAEYVKR